MLGTVSAMRVVRRGCSAPQLGARIGLGPGEAIDELVVGELLEPLQGEGRAQ